MTVAEQSQDTYYVPSDGWYPVWVAGSACAMMVGLALWLNDLRNGEDPSRGIFYLGALGVAFVLIKWFSQVIDENHAGLTSAQLKRSYIWAMAWFIFSEVMFFAGLIGAFIVFRFGSAIWPPPLQARLPVEVTGVNTAVLLFSAYTMYRAWRAARSGNRRGLLQGLWMTAILGTVFLAVQGYEWIRLLGFGLTMSSGVYGATFYTLIGFHALHVFGALCWLLVVLTMARNNRFSANRHIALDLCGMYWSFVVILWPVLYTLVYLN